MSYPVTFNAEQPPQFDRAQVALRLLIIILLSILANAFGWIYGLIYLGIPVVAAVLISQKGAQRYIAEAPNDMIKWLRFIVGFYGYIYLLADRLPDDSTENAIQFDVEARGAPSVGQTLLRIILAIPHALVLFFLGIVAAILAIIAAIMVLIQETYPASIYAFLRGYVRWQARVLAYMASLTEDYPPFAFDTGDNDPAAPTPTPAPTPEQ